MKTKILSFFSITALIIVIIYGCSDAAEPTGIQTEQQKFEAIKAELAQNKQAMQAVKNNAAHDAVFFQNIRNERTLNKGKNQVMLQLQSITEEQARWTGYASKAEKMQSVVAYVQNYVIPVQALYKKYELDINHKQFGAYSLYESFTNNFTTNNNEGCSTICLGVYRACVMSIETRTRDLESVCYYAYGGIDCAYGGGEDQSVCDRYRDCMNEVRIQHDQGMYNAFTMYFDCDYRCETGQ